MRKQERYISSERNSNYNKLLALTKNNNYICINNPSHASDSSTLAGLFFALIS